MNLYSHAARALNPHRSLPATRVAGVRHNPQLGATRPRGNRVPPVFADVMGAPTLKMERGQDGSVTTTLNLNSAFADYMTRDDLKALQDEATGAAHDARSLSRGGLTARELRRRGHPYGLGVRRGLGRLRGARSGISNRAIVNSQSGDFARSWSGYAALRKSGGMVTIRSADRKSGWLAFGTRTRNDGGMKAHYPAPTVMARRKFRIQKAWRSMARRAWAREMAMQGRATGGDPIAI